MRVYENEAKLHLLVDIDDFLVFSSDKLQTIVDKKTNFKTNVLQMLEQLNRNCSYLVDEVIKECQKAKLEKRKPELKKFLIFDNYVCNKEEELYTKPINFAKYYLHIARMFLNQFLEERDTFLEIDNLARGQKKEFNYDKELSSIIEYSEYIHNNKDAFHLINEFCLKQAKMLIEQAKMNNTDGELTIPEYGALVSMDTNDIIKKGSLVNIDDLAYKEYILYIKPLQNLTNCIKHEDRIYDIISNAKVFLNPSDEIVDYRSIHSIDNVNWDAVSLVEELIHSGMFEKVYFATHHNGRREEEAKIRLMRQILPEADGFIGQRFHDSEHDAKRRDRSSKASYASDYLGISPTQIVLLDDSKANCKDCEAKGGTAILYKPETDSEKINGKIEETGFNRILDLKNNDVYGSIAKAYVKGENKKVYKKNI